MIRPLRRMAALPAILAGLILDTPGVHAQGVVDVPSRGETVRILVEAPAPDGDSAQPRPIGAVVLFAGGKGVLRITGSGRIRKLRGNFLVRSRALFRRHSFITAVIDAPTDRRHDLYGFRGSAAHAADVAAVIGHLRTTHDVPVWLAGTSRGTNSVANAAVRLHGPAAPDGVVLTATMLKANDKGDQVLDYDLGAVRLPVIIAHHRRDNCWVTPPEGVDDLRDALHRARLLEVLWYEGGRDEGPDCQAKGHHGFAGLEEQVVGDIARLVKATF